MITTFDKPGETLWTVPPNVHSVTFELFGAQGGGNGGLGGRAVGTASVTPGETFKIIVGGAGADGVDGVGHPSGTQLPGAPGGIGGGGLGGPTRGGGPVPALFGRSGAGGGGASAVADSGPPFYCEFCHRILCAGGGGGGGGSGSIGTKSPPNGGQYFPSTAGGKGGAGGNPGVKGQDIGPIQGGGGAEVSWSADGSTMTQSSVGGDGYDPGTSTDGQGGSHKGGGNGGAGSGDELSGGGGGGGGGGMVGGGGGGGATRTQLVAGKNAGGGGGGGGGGGASSTGWRPMKNVEFGTGVNTGDGLVVVMFEPGLPPAPRPSLGAVLAQLVLAARRLVPRVLRDWLR